MKETDPYLRPSRALVRLREARCGEDVLSATWDVPPLQRRRKGIGERR
jgi:hypothetical protein